MDIGFVWDEVKYSTALSSKSTTSNSIRWFLLSMIRTDLKFSILFTTKIVVYTEQDLPLYRIITAYDAERSWLDEYYQR